MALAEADGAAAYVPQGVTGVYYWRTSWRLSERESRWLTDHGIRRVYLRLFDVVVRGGAVQPNATLQFADSLAPDGSSVAGNLSGLPHGTEVVPTVFIVEDVFRHPTTPPEALARSMAQRVRQMAQTRGFSFSELQTDCDWTASTREPYYRFLTALGRELPGVRLSSTIRLHQLSQPAPPVDGGVLMVYNTGDFRTSVSTDHNPILDLRDVRPYLRHLGRYPLPLTAAYPAFSWQLLYAGTEFRGILYGVDLTDRSCFLPTETTRGGAQRYEVVASRTIVMSMGGATLHLQPGMTVSVWRVAAADLRKVSRELERLRPGINSGAVLYHLDEAAL